MTAPEFLAEIAVTAPILAAKLRKLPPQQLEELIHSKETTNE